MKRHESSVGEHKPPGWRTWIILLKNKHHLVEGPELFGCNVFTIHSFSDWSTLSLLCGWPHDVELSWTLFVNLAATIWKLNWGSWDTIKGFEVHHERHLEFREIRNIQVWERFVAWNDETHKLNRSGILFRSIWQCSNIVKRFKTTSMSMFNEKRISPKFPILSVWSYRPRVGIAALSLVRVSTDSVCSALRCSVASATCLSNALIPSDDWLTM